MRRAFAASARDWAVRASRVRFSRTRGISESALEVSLWVIVSAGRTRSWALIITSIEDGRNRQGPGRMREERCRFLRFLPIHRRRERSCREQVLDERMPHNEIDEALERGRVETPRLETRWSSSPRRKPELAHDAAKRLEAIALRAGMLA